MRRTRYRDASPVETTVFAAAVVSGLLITFNLIETPASVADQYPRLAVSLWGFFMSLGGGLSLVGSLWPRHLQHEDGVIVRKVKAWPLIVQMVGLSFLGLTLFAHPVALVAQRQTLNTTAVFNAGIAAGCAWLWWRINDRLNEDNDRSSARRLARRVRRAARGDRGESS